MTTLFRSALCLVLLGLTPAWAELQPGEVAVLVSKNSKDSQAVAAHYVRARKIPANQVCLIDLPQGEVMDRTQWENTVRPTIRRWIADNRLQTKIKCFVTTFDVPLKIGKVSTPDTNTRRRKRLLELERSRRMTRLAEFAQQFDAIASTGQGAAEPFPAGGDIKAVTAYLGGRLKAAEARIKALTPGPTQQQAIQKLTQLSVATAGLGVVVQNMQQQLAAGKTSERLVSEFQYGRGRLTGLGEGQQLLDGLPASPERDTNLIALLERNNGIAGSVSWIDQQLAMLESNETYASFDSELALVMENPYPLLRWQPNYLHYNYEGAPIRALSRTLMVARLDAPTVDLAKALVDKAMAVEAKGLTGTVYFDARGVGKLEGDAPTVGTVDDYDRSVLLAAQLVEDNTQLQVVLNDKAELFAEGACPNAALYCGWYALSKYVDSFSWADGAIGYHMASGEAATLRNKDSQVWCKRMLEEGITGTMGPVYEPYLLAFPKPHEFFALLLSGKYTYVECVYRTKSTNSWAMTTVGDPLYNPFRSKPALTTVPPAYRRLFGLTGAAAN